MIGLLAKLFIKNSNNPKDEKVRAAYGTLASVFGIFSNLLVSVMKLIVGFITNTISIIADGFNNLSDMLSSLVSLFGFKMSQKKADKEHPYGHQRMEYIASFVVSVVIVVVGIQLINDSISKIRNPEETTDKFILNAVILGIAILIKLYQAIVYYRIGKKIDSITLKATASDSRNDVVATSVVLIGLIISHFSKYNLDGYFGVAVGLLICYTGFKLVLESANPLIGEGPDLKLTSDIKNTILANNLILGVHDLQIHSYGPSMNFASCDVEVDSSLDLITVHEQIDNIELECREKYNTKLTIHVDPVIIGDTTTAYWRDFIENIIKSTYDFKFEIPDFRVSTNSNRTKLIVNLVLPFDLKVNDDTIIDTIKKKAEMENKDVLLALYVDHAALDNDEN